MNLQKLRSAARLTQAILAKLTGYSLRTVQRHEAGTTKMKPHHVEYYKRVIGGK